MPTLPRHIEAATIQKGDRVKVELPRNQGVLHTIEGTVDKVEISGGVTYFYTAEGANILAYYPGISGIRVLLISRENKQPLFSANFWADNNDDVFEGLQERIEG
jgi:hypothetical protein